MRRRGCEEDLYYHLRHTLIALMSREPLSSAISHLPL